MKHDLREEKQQIFRKDALVAWETFEATGQHVTAEEADRWLSQLEKGNDIQPPMCHNSTRLQNT